MFRVSLSRGSTWADFLNWLCVLKEDFRCSVGQRRSYFCHLLHYLERLGPFLLKIMIGSEFQNWKDLGVYLDRWLPSHGPCCQHKWSLDPHMSRTLPNRQRKAHIGTHSWIVVFQIFVDPIVFHLVKIHLRSGLKALWLLSLHFLIWCLVKYRLEEGTFGSGEGLTNVLLLKGFI